MKKLTISLLLVFTCLSLFAAYGIGDVVDDITINYQIPGGESGTTSIYEQIDAGKPVMMFFGGTG